MGSQGVSHDLGPQKVAKGQANLVISAKSRLVKYCTLASKISFWLTTQREEILITWSNTDVKQRGTSQASKWLTLKIIMTSKVRRCSRTSARLYMRSLRRQGIGDVAWWWHTWWLQKMKVCFGIEFNRALPETAKASENRPFGPKGKFIFQPLIFRDQLLVSGRVNLQKQ